MVNVLCSGDGGSLLKSSWAHMGNHLKQKLDIQSKETGN